MLKPHSFCYRIYYEDTDAGGIVYYANYLKFAERARTDLLRSLGISQSTLLEQHKAFVVKHLEVSYHKPAQLDDQITVNVALIERRSASLLFQQTISDQHNQLLCTLNVQIVAIDTVTMKPYPIKKMGISGF